MKGAERVVRALDGVGIETAFGLPGSQNLALFEALRTSRIRTVVPTHELAASFMANGYARASGRPGVLVTIPGPGFTYALTGLAEAYLDSTPILHVLAPPAVSEYCIPYADRSTARTDPGCIVREVVIDDADVAFVGGVRCTTRLRTAFDLLRDVHASDHDAAVVVGALVGGAHGLDVQLRDRIESAHRLPHKARALARLDAAARQPSLTR